MNSVRPRPFFDSRYRVRRQLLYAMLGLPDGIAANFTARYENVSLPSDDYDRDKGTYTGKPVPGTYTVVVKPGRPLVLRRRNMMLRVYVICSCGKEVSFGRLCQHKPYCKVPTVADLKVGTIFETLAGTAWEPVGSGNIYKIARHCDIVGKVTCYTQFTGLKVQLHPTGRVKVIKEDIYGF